MLLILEMNCSTKIAKCHTHGWLDSLAISMSVICAVHCLLTPLLIALLPIISTTFWVHENFHLWMVFLVVPTTSLAVFMGCRKHKDKLVAALSITGLAFILFIAVYQYIFHAGHPLDANGICTSCTHHGSGSFLNLTTILNSVGGLFLACAHFRNFKLCRKADCNHS
jgi:phosphoglycerol transferase MdoB-like AlkP superfamily enzyme